MRSRIAVAVVVACFARNAFAERKEVSASHVESLTAKVTKIDLKTRMVTVAATDGTERTFQATEEVRNLDRVKVGDTIQSKTEQTLRMWVLGADEAAPPLASTSEVTRAAPGETPGGSARTELSGSGTVEAIAADRSSVTLKGPRGDVVSYRVKDPAKLEGITVGTRVGMAYTETVAISLTPAKAGKKQPAAKKQ